MPDDPGVLGNLPRSRPGRRSDKRGSRASGGAAAKPKAKTASKPRSASTRKATASRRTAPPRPKPQPHSGGTDPVTGAIRVAGQVAGVGFKVAGEILKRLPGR